MITGAGICALVIAMASYMVIKTTNEINRL